MLNQKCVEILQFIRKSEDYIKLSDLAEKYSVTDRTIRYDVDKIEQFLVKNGFKPFDRHHIKGIRLEEQQGLDKFIDSFVNTRTPYKYSYSKEERIKFILIKLLQNSSPMQIENLVAELYTSKNTIIKDLDLLEEWLKKTKLNLIRRPRVGIWVEGEEIFRRQAISKLLSESIDIEDIVSYMSSKMVKTKINNLQFETLFSDIEVDFLNNIVVDTENNLGIHFSDEAYGNLITHIAIMIKRIQLNKDIYLPEIDISSIENKKEYLSAMDIIAKIQEKYKITVPDNEIGYIALHLLGSKIINTSETENHNASGEKDLYDVAIAMTEEMESIYNVDFGESKTNIIEGLLMHLRPMLYRVRFNLNLVNPIFDEIMHEYRELFQNTKYVVRLLEEYAGFSVSEHEISYITLHFGAALQNTKKEKGNKRIVVVCGTGIGTSRMVASQLESKFNVDIVATVSSRAITELKNNSYDLIVSTVDIPELDKNSYIKISPLLIKKDYEKLKQYFEQKSSQSAEYDENLVNRLVKIVEKYCIVNDREHLQYEMCHELKNRDRNYNVKRSIYMLNDLLTREFIKLNIECEDWKEALKEGTDLLVKQNCAEEKYYDAILENFAKLGPYMVVAPGIALSHARPENGVKKLSMSLVTLKTPVPFGSKTNDPVKLILTLAAIDNESHMKALVQIMELFMNSEDLEKVKNCTNKEELLEIIKKYSN